MEAHQLRMAEELEQLSQRIEALKAFIELNPIFQSLGETSKSLMKTQYHAMIIYKTTLASRLELSM